MVERLGKRVGGPGRSSRRSDRHRCREVPGVGLPLPRLPPVGNRVLPVQSRRDAERDELSRRRPRACARRNRRGARRAVRALQGEGRRCVAPRRTPTADRASPLPSCTRAARPVARKGRCSATATSRNECGGPGRGMGLLAAGRPPARATHVPRPRAVRRRELCARQRGLDGVPAAVRRRRRRRRS